MSETVIKDKDLRESVVELKKALKDLNEIDSENSDYIMKEINEMKVEIQSKLSSLDVNRNEEKSEIEMRFKSLNSDYERLNKFISDSSLYLAKYNLKLSQTLLKSIRTQIDDKKDSLIPKTKFSFKTSFKSNPKTNVISRPNVELMDEMDSTNRKIESTPFFGFKNMTNCETVLRMSAEESNSKDLQLDGLENCRIEITGAPNALKINNLLNCSVFCGPITTSALVANCKDCSFRIASQQLRIHCSNECRIYLHVTSRAIIEDSKGIGFATFDWTYDRIEDDFKFAHLDRNTNNWRLIDDFDCLAADKPSDNWSFI